MKTKVDNPIIKSVENILHITFNRSSNVSTDKLTEAKKIIRNLLRVTYGEGWNYSLDWKVKAEQFLSEVEE